MSHSLVLLYQKFLEESNLALDRKEVELRFKIVMVDLKIVLGFLIARDDQMTKN
jgi:hypothetical protein